jgi:putative resolvase
MKQNEQSNEKYITSATVREHYGVSNTSLQRWANDGKIKTIRTTGGHRLYERESIAKLFGDQKEKTKRRVCYARVSSAKQKEDLERQAEDLKKDYPNHEIIKDVGSGVNFNRKGFKTLVDSIIDGDIQELVISHKDRLTRFGYELIEQLCKKFDCTIVVQFKDERHNPEEELAEDLLAITTVFVARHNGLGAGEKKRKRKENKETKVEKERGTSENEGSSSEMHED